MKKEQKWKVVISENVVKKMEKLPEKGQKMVMRAIEKLVENPYSGKPFNGVEIKAWNNEACKCGKPFGMVLELDDNEVHFSCKTGTCDESFWCTKRELINGRKNHVRNAQAAGQRLEYRDIELLTKTRGHLTPFES